MAENKKTAPTVPTAIGTEQPLQMDCTNSITENSADFNSFEDNYELIMKKMPDPTYLPTISMTELYNNIYDRKQPLIDGLLYAGVYLFVGAPKVGKSFFMLQLAYHVSTGTNLWNYHVRKGTVLYLALVDDYRRLQERLYRMFGTENTPNLHFSVTANYLGKGLNEQLQGFISEHPDTSLIIIDTLQKVREVGGESFSYASDYEIITQLKQFADSCKICLLLVHHTRKQKSDDTFDMISGTNGLLGAADGAFLLHKERRTSNKATLEISGRDQQDQKITLVRNENKLSWDFDNAETELWKEPPDPILEAIANLVTSDNPEWSGTATDLAQQLGTDLKPNVLTLKLNVTAGRLLNDYGIIYGNTRTHNGRNVTLKLKA